MASAITLEGIDQSISNLKYKNKNTLKYRFVQHIRQYYTSESSVVSLNEIDHEALINAKGRFENMILSMPKSCRWSAFNACCCVRPAWA